MDRELVLAALVLAFSGTLAWLGGGAPARAGAADRSGRWLERQAWRAVWRPVLPAMLSVALLVGWALQEPDEADERLAPALLVLLTPAVVLCLRAAARAIRSARQRDEGAPAATVGLIRPRVVIHPAFRAALDSDALAAVVAHEEAHRRHRDPLRLLLAQAVTDLQWPWRPAQARLAAWRETLELARDEEAVDGGADGADLAAAIVAASRLASETGSTLGVHGAARGLRHRVERLLGGQLPQTVENRRAGRRWSAALVSLLFITALATGVLCGDAVVSALPGVTR